MVQKAQQQKNSDLLNMKNTSGGEEGGGERKEDWEQACKNVAYMINM